MWIVLPEPERHTARQRGPASFSQTLRQAGSWRLVVIMVTYFIAIAGFAIVTVIYPQVGQRRFELNQSQISYIFVMVGLIGAGIQGGGIGRLSKRFGDVNLAIAGFAIMAIGMLLMPLAGSVPLFLLFTVLLAVGNSLSQPTVNAIASKGASATLQGRVLGLVQSSGSLGRVFGPIIAGYLLSGDHARPTLQYGNTPFAAGGILTALAFGLATTLRRSEPLKAATPTPVEADRSE
jgi:MFS family permease